MWSGVVLELILEICKSRFSRNLFLLSKDGAIDADILEVLEKLLVLLDDIMLKLLKVLVWKIPSSI
jgi:hypothetical protein